jgi:DNA repair exonuclease SbcCD nuclease subunit
VDAFVIAGDLFDGETLALSTERFLGEEFARLGEAGITVVYATGNHDPGSGTAHAGRIEWPANVVVADGPEPVSVEIDDGRGGIVGRISAVGHASSRISQDLSKAIPVPGGGARIPEVAVLHTQVLGSVDAESHDRYAPSELGALSRSGHDYWALGHVHRRQTLSETPRICYPGTPQGLSIRESGPKGILLVEIPTPGAATARFIEQAPVRWEALEITDPIDEANLTALVRRVEQEWSSARGEDLGNPGCEFIVRVTLRGRTPLVHELSNPDGIETLQGELRKVTGALDVEVRTRALSPPIAWEDHRERSDVLGEALRLVEEIRAHPHLLEIDPTQLAGLAHAGGEAELDQYIRRLLDGAEPAVAAALLTDPDDR